MPGATVGFFGKLPSHGDFIERRVSGAFRDLWDDWMQRSIVESQQELGGRWLDYYLTSPIWRFYLCDGVAGAASYAGILLPSVDRVGRYFPLTVVVELPAGGAAAGFARAATAWFETIEQLCAAALEDPNLDFAAFDAALQASGERLDGLDRLPPPPAFPGSSPQWHWPTGSVDGFATAVSEPLMSLAQGALRPMTMWWTAGSEQIEPCVLLSRALPRTDSFAALLAGTWDDGRWDGVIPSGEAPAEVTLEPDVQLQFESGAASDPGTAREQNQDHFLAADDRRLWAVADGMGGHSHGEVASQMVIDALNAMEAPSTLNAVFQAMAVSLTAVNLDLRRGALGTGDRAAASGSTVVALAIRGGEWGVAWAGDSRAYLWRDAELLQLTQDHSVGAADVPAGAPPSNGAITRAVGGHDNLELDFIADLVAANDRFLICSDGLYVALDVSTLVEVMRVPVAQDAANALIEAARKAGAKDNITAVVIDVKSLGLDT